MGKWAIVCGDRLAECCVRKRTQVCRSGRGPQLDAVEERKLSRRMSQTRPMLGIPARIDQLGARQPGNDV